MPYRGGGALTPDFVWLYISTLLDALVIVVHKNFDTSLSPSLHPETIVQEWEMISIEEMDEKFHFRCLEFIERGYFQSQKLSSFTSALRGIRTILHNVYICTKPVRSEIEHQIVFELFLGRVPSHYVDSDGYPVMSRAVDIINQKDLNGIRFRVQPLPEAGRAKFVADKSLERLLPSRVPSDTLLPTALRSLIVNETIRERERDGSIILRPTENPLNKPASEVETGQNSSTSTTDQSKTDRAESSKPAEKADASTSQTTGETVASSSVEVFQEGNSSNQVEPSNLAMNATAESTTESCEKNVDSVLDGDSEKVPNSFSTVDPSLPSQVEIADDESDMEPPIKRLHVESSS